MVKRKKILIYGWFGENNLGDELLLKSTLELFDPKKFKCYVMGTKPKKVYKNHKNIYLAATSFSMNLKKIVRTLVISPISSIRCLHECDILVVAGGGALSDWNLSSTRDLFFLINYFHKKNKKIFLFGIGAGPFLYGGNNGEFLEVLSKANFISTRDAYSYDLLKSIGLKNIVKSNDLAIYSEYALNKNIYPKKIKKIGIVLVPVCQKDIKIYTELKRQISLLIKELSSKYEVSIIEFQKEYDNDFVNSLDFDRKKVKVYSESNNIWNIIKYVDDQDLIIGMRYHSLVLAIELKKYLIPIVYHSKSQELCKEFNLEEYASYIGDGENWEKSMIDYKNIIDSIEKIKANPYYSVNMDEIFSKKREKSLEKEMIERLNEYESKNI